MLSKKVEEALGDVDLAFRQFEFAVKLMLYCENSEIDKDKFDGDITYLEEKGDNMVFPDNSFGSYDEIVSCSRINVSLAFAATAIALDSAFKVAGFKHTPDLAGDVRAMVYMVRCVFAHGITDPKWEVRGGHRKKVHLDLNGVSLEVDFAQLNGSVFDYKHVGGWSGWYRIKDAAIALIRGNQVAGG